MRFHKHPLYSPLHPLISASCRFEGDPNATNPDGKPGGGAGAGKTEDPATKTYELTVDGKKVAMTMEELMTNATKAAGAEKRFREASELSKKYDGIDPDVARKGLRVMELGRKLGQGATLSDEEASEFWGGLSIDVDKVQGGAGGKGKPAGPPQKVKLEDLDPEAQKAIKFMQEQQYQATERKINEEIKNSVDKDKVLSTIKTKMPEGQRTAFGNALYDMAESDTWAQIASGRPVGPELYDYVVQRMRQRITNFGIPSDPNSLPTSKAIEGYEMFGPAVGLDEPVKRKKVSDEGYDDNASTRLAQMIARNRRVGISHGSR